MSKTKTETEGHTTINQTTYTLFDSWIELVCAIVLLGTVFIYYDIEIQFEKNGVSGVYVSSNIEGRK